MLEVWQTRASLSFRGIAATHRSSVACAAPESMASVALAIPGREGAALVGG